MPIESGHAGGHQHAGSVVPAGTTTTSAPPPVASNTQQGWLKALGDAALAGSVSGMVARCFIHPADTVKAQLQVQGALRGTLAYQSTVHAVKQIARTQGASGFYKGFGVAVVGTAPGNMAYFGGYEIGKAIVPTTGWEASGDMAVGAIAQLIAGVVFNPIDIIKERLQSQAIMSKVYTYNGGMDAIRDLLNKSGPAGLLKGYWVTNAAWIPWNMMFVAMYELFDMVSLGLILMVSHLIVSTLQRSKASAAQHVVCSGRTEELPPAVTASCAFASAACAAAATTPVDVVKTRLQVFAAGKGGEKLTAREIALQIWRIEGGAGFFSGCTARILSIAPEAAIVWCLYELLTTTTSRQAMTCFDDSVSTKQHANQSSSAS